MANSRKKPEMQDYGFHIQMGFDDEPTGWLIEGGEEAYYEALGAWEAESAKDPRDNPLLEDDSFVHDVDMGCR